MLFYFSLASCVQSLTWFSFSSLNEQRIQGYFGPGMSTSSLALLLNWGPMVGTLAFPFQTWVLRLPGGLQKGIWIGVVCVLAANIIRCVPIAITETSGSSLFAQSDVAYALYHLGQILNALAGPFLMATKQGREGLGLCYACGRSRDAGDRTGT